MSMSFDQPAPTLEDVWRLFRENAEQQKKTARMIEETDRQLQEAIREMRQQSKETDLMFQETDRQFKETDRQFKETDRKLQESGKKIGELGNRLGEFVEGLIKPSVTRLFQERGIAVHKTASDINANNPELDLAMQIDLFVINSDACALIEVKSKLSLDDVNEHIERMGKFKPLYPEYADKKVYGAVAAMIIPDNIAKYGYRQGFFIITRSGDSAVMLNDMAFRPKAW